MYITQVLCGRDTYTSTSVNIQVSRKESGGFTLSNMVSNSAHTDWNINVQKDESSKINELQSTVTNKTIQMDI